jgi:hypothetical protein
MRLLSARKMHISIHVCDVTLSVYPHRARLKNMPGYGGWATVARHIFNLATSQTSHSPEYTTPTQKKSFSNHLETEFVYFVPRVLLEICYIAILIWYRARNFAMFMLKLKHWYALISSLPRCQWVYSFSAGPYKRRACTPYGFADSFLRFGAWYVDENTTVRISEKLYPNS